MSTGNSCCWTEILSTVRLFSDFLQSTLKQSPPRVLNRSRFSEAHTSVSSFPEDCCHFVDVGFAFPRWKFNRLLNQLDFPTHKTCTGTVAHRHQESWYLQQRGVLQPAVFVVVVEIICSIARRRKLLHAPLQFHFLTTVPSSGPAPDFLSSHLCHISSLLLF